MKSTLVSSTAMTLQLQNFTVRYIHRGFYYSATSRIDSGFKINMYYLIQYIYLLFSMVPLQENYSTFKPSSLPKT